MDLSKALPTTSYSSLGALVILGTEQGEQGLLSFPFVPRAAEVRGWKGKAARMEQGGLRCSRERLWGGVSRRRSATLPRRVPGTRRTRVRETEPSPGPQNHRSVLSPPVPALRSDAPGGAGEGTPGRDAGTERGDTGLGGQQSPDPPPRPGMLFPSSPSTHLHSPSEGETEARTGAWGGTGAGRSRATASRKRAPAPQAAAAGRPGPPLLCPSLSAFPSPRLPDPPPRPGGPGPGGAGRGAAPGPSPPLCCCRCCAGSFGAAGPAAQRSPSRAFCIWG